MPINDSVFDLYLQLGIAGATLMIMLVFVVLLFKFVGKDNSRVDKLCDKIDVLVSSYAENTKQINNILLSNDKDQSQNVNLLNTILDTVVDVNRRVSRIDDRTYHCISNNYDKGEEKGE